MEGDLAVVGRRLPRVDAPQKVTGEAKYVTDVRLAGMLHGKILRSPYSHARILRIDTSKAEALPGVRAVITAEDTPKVPFCLVPHLANRLPLAHGKVRYVGDEVAAVAATDERAAQEALKLIEVDYDVVPAVFDPEEAMKPGAMLIHEERGTNVAFSIDREFGNVEQGFRESDYIVEDTFSTQAFNQCCLETKSYVASFDSSGKLTLWTPSQTPHILPEQLATVLGMPASLIRVIKPYVGGSFGRTFTLDPSAEPIAALLAKKAGRPVKIRQSRSEEFATARMQYPMTLHLKTGIKKDGMLVARHIRVVMDNGAYNSLASAVAGVITFIASCLYRVQHVKVEAYVVDTNKPYFGTFRGLSNTPVTFAIESQMDTIAEALEMDPMEIRLKNANRTGDITLFGGAIPSCGLPECIERAAEAIGWKEKHGKPGNRGIGMACLVHTAGGSKSYYGQDCNLSSTFVKANIDGTVNVISGAVELGQGVETVLAQIVAEEIGVPLSAVRVLNMVDTEVSPPCLGARGSRSTFIAGNAAKLAGQDARKQILEMASHLLEASPTDLEAREGKVFVRGSPERHISVEQAIADGFLNHGTAVLGRGSYNDPSPGYSYVTGVGTGNPVASFTYACQAAEVEVDPETGLVTVLRVVAAHDLGKAINPMSAEGQVEGGSCQGMGYGLTEEVIFESGKIENANLMDYTILTAPDMPPITSILVETDDPYGPFGAKGLGEPACVGIPAAIANAVYDAIGVRVKELPLTSQRVLKALQGGLSEKQPEERPS